MGCQLRWKAQLPLLLLLRLDHRPSGLVRRNYVHLPPHLPF